MKILSIFVATLLAMSLVTGCKKKEPEKKEDKKSAAAAKDKAGEASEAPIEPDEPNVAD